MVIGITGPTGAGKTTALDILASMGFMVLDCDKIYHDLLNNSAELQNDLSVEFPNCLTDGRIDRRKLAAVVFADAFKLQRLNEIAHRSVKNEVIRILSSLPDGSDAAIDAFALHDGGLDELCDKTVAVLAPRADRIERIMTRDALSRSEAESRIAAQKPDEYYESVCDIVLLNNFSSYKEFSIFCAEFFRPLKEVKNERT